MNQTSAPIADFPPPAIAPTAQVTVPPRSEEPNAGDDPAEIVRLLAGEIRTRLHDAQQRESQLHEQEKELQSRYRALRASLDQQRGSPGGLQRLTDELAQLDAQTARLHEQRRRLGADEQVVARLRARLESVERSLLELFPGLDQPDSPDAPAPAARNSHIFTPRRNWLHDRVARVRQLLQQRPSVAAPGGAAATPSELAAPDSSMKSDALAERNAAAEALALALSERRATLERDEQELRQRELEHKSRKEDLAAQQAELERQQSEWTERRQSHAGQAAALAAQADQLATRRAELDTMESAERQRQSAVAAALREQEEGLLDEQRVLEEQTRSLRMRAASLREALDELDQREGALLQRDDELREKARRLDEFAGELAARAAQIQLSQQQLRLLGDDVEQQRSELADLQREAGQARDTLARQQDVLRAEQARLENLRLDTESIAAQLRDRRAELEQRERALTQRATALEMNSVELAEARAEIERRRSEIDALYAQAASTQDDARRGFDESQQLREQLIAEHAELRGSTLRLAAEWQQVEQERAQLAALRDELHRRAAELAATEQKLANPPAPAPIVPAVAPPAAALSGRGWLRGLLISAAVGSACALAWWQIELPEYRASCMIQVDGERDLAAHIAGLLDADRAAANLGDLAAPWVNALRAGQVQARPTADQPQFELLLTTAAPQDVGLLRGVAERYVRHVATLPPLERDSAAVARWESQMAQLETRRAQAEQDRASAEQALQALPVDAYERAFAELQRLRTDLQETERSVAARRAELDALLAEDAPRASITSEMLNTALAADAVYTEDTRELAVELRKHRTELAVSMVLVSDPLRELRAVVQAAAHTLAEQRGLQPPVELLAALDRCDDVLSEFDSVLGSFASDWDTQREGVERSNGPTQPAELLSTQRSLRTRAQDLLSRATALIDDYARRVESLAGEAADSSRAVVIAAVLRSDVGRLREQLGHLELAAKSTDLTNNPRLDTSDRQIRNLVGRLEQRAELARHRLEEAAIEQARAAHSDAIRAARDALAAAEEDRPELLDLFQRGMERLEQARGTVHQRLEAQAALATAEQRLAALVQEQETLAAARPIPRAESAAVTGIRIDPISGRDRQRNAALAGLSGAAATALACFLFTAGRLRRPNASTAQLDGATIEGPRDERSAGVAAR